MVSLAVPICLLDRLGFLVWVTLQVLEGKADLMRSAARGGTGGS